MGTVNMSIGQGFGQMLTTLAREKHTEALNPAESISFLQEALKGLPRDLALQLLSNEVRFAGYDPVTADKHIPLTQTQMNALIAYGDSCWGGTPQTGRDSKMMRTS